MKNLLAHLVPDSVLFPVPGAGSVYKLHEPAAKSDRSIPDAAVAGYGLQRISVFNRNLKVVGLKAPKSARAHEQKTRA